MSNKIAIAIVGAGLSACHRDIHEESLKTDNKVTTIEDSRHKPTFIVTAPEQLEPIGIVKDGKQLRRERRAKNRLNKKRR